MKINEPDFLKYFAKGTSGYGSVKESILRIESANIAN